MYNIYSGIESSWKVGGGGRETLMGECVTRTEVGGLGSSPKIFISGSLKCASEYIYESSLTFKQNIH